LDKISRWFWLLTQHQLNDYARFDEPQHRFLLTENIIEEAPPGYYQLITRNQKQQAPSFNAHTYRLNHPLGEWVLDTAKNTETPTASIVFDYAGHGAKITVIEALRGQSGILKLQRFSVEALGRSEDHLLFAAITHDGNVLPAETAQKMMQLPALSCQLQQVIASPQIENALTAVQNDIIQMVNIRVESCLIGKTKWTSAEKH